MLRLPKNGRLAPIAATLMTVGAVGCIDIPPPPVAADSGGVIDASGGVDVPVVAPCESTCGTYCVDDECVGVLTFSGHADHLCARMTDGPVYC
ncbi:MAG: hypothetical protein ACI9OJ_005502 [Myxococcota bacterium]|jgi:hypothetical protein